ncbi:MAG TPA: DUF2341 domain-containing protein [bacterium]|nr:DUF2341 domain-containing protein [bacterium]
MLSLLARLPGRPALAAAVVAPALGLAWPAEAPAAWHDPSWSHRQRITVLSTLADSTLTGFPVLVALSDPGNALFARAQADGDDLLFTDSDEITQLPHEIEQYDPGTGTLTAWVRLPAVPAAGDTTIYVYYGNASTGPQEQPGAVWDADYEAVWHLSDDFDDSTVQGHSASNSGSTNAPGQVANGQAFDGGSDFVDLGPGCYVGSAFTLEAWILPNSPQGKDRVFLFGDLECAGRQATMAWATTPGRIEVFTATDGVAGSPDATTAAITGGVWSHVAWTFDGSTHRLWVDGVSSSGPSSGASLAVSGRNYLGTKDSGNYWNGSLDEPRVSRVARPGPWITSSYRTARSPGTYLIFGGEEVGTRSIVKRAFEVDGTPIATGATVPAGKIVKFLLYVPNSAPAAADVSVRDVLDPAFAYVAGSMRVDDTLTAAAACPGGVCDETAIFTQVDGAGTPVGDGDASTPPLDGDVASYDGLGAAIDFGSGSNPDNAQLDVPAGRVWAAVFSVRMQ